MRAIQSQNPFFPRPTILHFIYNSAFNLAFNKGKSTQILEQSSLLGSVPKVIERQ
jgi:hypothetical protein